MNIVQSIVLGIIQGITEFFPVSSSGHLVLVPFFLGWEYPPLYFTVTVHFATLLAVVTVFFKDIYRIIKALATGIFIRNMRRSYEFRTGIFIIIATIPAALAGYFLNEQVGGFFSRPLAVAAFLLLTAFILWISEWRGKKKEQKPALGFLTAIAAGIGQMLAIFPGISRSGSTISFVRFFGVKRVEAVRFSFLLSIPIILGSFIFEISRSAGSIFSGGNTLIWNLAAGFLSAYISGYFAVKYLLYFTEKKNLNVFSVYCVCLSAAIFIFYIIEKTI